MKYTDSRDGHKKLLHNVINIDDKNMKVLQEMFIPHHGQLWFYHG